MKKIILLTLCTLLLSGCSKPDVLLTDEESYKKTEKRCTMTGYSVVAGWSSSEPYSCEKDESIRLSNFRNCADYCDTAIDDYRDVSNYADASVQCLRLCMQE